MYKHYFENRVEQKAFESAYDTILYGHSRTVWENSCGLDSYTADEIWSLAWHTIMSCN